MPDDAVTSTQNYDDAPERQDIDQSVATSGRPGTCDRTAAHAVNTSFSSAVIAKDFRKHSAGVAGFSACSGHAEEGPG
jgi:hypothetical protein